MPSPIDSLTGSLSEVQTQLASLQAQVVTAAEQIRAQARSELTEKLNNAVRRLRQADARAVWFRTLLDVTTDFAGKTAGFSVGSRVIRYEGEPYLEAPITAAPAFQNVIDSKDVVVAAASARELSPAFFDLLGVQPGNKVWLFPLVVHNKVEGVLYADSVVDVSALELLCSLAGASVEATEVKTETAPADLIHITGAPEPPKPAQPPRPSWTDLSSSDQQVHLKAQRFARSAVAEFVLSKSEQVRRGRTSNDLYSSLREEIDAARQSFRRQFIHASSSMVDYLHLELVRTLAKDDARALGADYPGPLR